MNPMGGPDYNRRRLETPKPVDFEKLSGSVADLISLEDLDLSILCADTANLYQQAIQKQANLVFDHIFGTVNFTKKRLHEIAREIYDYSYNSSRIHGTYGSSCLALIKTGEFGLNCEMSSLRITKII